MKHHTIEELPMSARFIIKIDQWGTWSKIEEYGNKIQFLNRTKKQFDWDNDELDNNEELVEDKAVYLPVIPYDMPGIDSE